MLMRRLSTCHRSIKTPHFEHVLVALSMVLRWPHIQVLGAPEHLNHYATKNMYHYILGYFFSIDTQKILHFSQMKTHIIINISSSSSSIYCQTIDTKYEGMCVLFISMSFNRVPVIVHLNACISPFGGHLIYTISKSDFSSAHILFIRQQQCIVSVFN